MGSQLLEEDSDVKGPHRPVASWGWVAAGVLLVFLAALIALSAASAH